VFARSIAAVLILAGATAVPDARADEAVVVGIKASKACTAKSATAADVGEVAYSPDAFLGKCVSLQGYWRDLAIYPTRAEAAQPDARSMSFLDRRRIGLYLDARDDARAPGSPAAAHLVGVVGSCAKLLSSGAQATGYCQYKTGAYLAVSSASVDK